MTSLITQKVDTFFAHFPVITFTKGEIIIHPDQPLTDIFLLKTGKVRMYVISANGEEITLHIFRANSYFPVMLFLSNISNTYFFESLEQSTTIKAPAPSVLEFIKKEPDALLDLTMRFSDALCGLLVRIETLAGEDAFVRLIHLLLYLADRFGQKEGASVVISLAISHEDIANWIGLRRETVSRHIEKLQKLNLITIHKKELIIPDTQKLKTALETIE